MKLKLYVYSHRFALNRRNVDDADKNFCFRAKWKKRKNACGRDKCLVYLCCNCVVKIFSLRLIHHLPPRETTTRV